MQTNCKINLVIFLLAISIFSENITMYNLFKKNRKNKISYLPLIALQKKENKCEKLCNFLSNLLFSCLYKNISKTIQLNQQNIAIIQDNLYEIKNEIYNIKNQQNTNFQNINLKIKDSENNNNQNTQNLKNNFQNLIHKKNEAIIDINNKLEKYIKFSLNLEKILYNSQLQNDVKFSEYFQILDENNNENKKIYDYLDFHSKKFDLLHNEINNLKNSQYNDKNLKLTYLENQIDNLKEYFNESKILNNSFLYKIKNVIENQINANSKNIPLNQEFNATFI